MGELRSLPWKKVNYTSSAACSPAVWSLALLVRCWKSTRKIIIYVYAWQGSLCPLTSNPVIIDWYYICRPLYRYRGIRLKHDLLTKCLHLNLDQWRQRTASSCLKHNFVQLKHMFLADFDINCLSLGLQSTNGPGQKQRTELIWLVLLPLLSL